VSAAPLSLQDRKIVVTGGLGALGRAVVAELAARGAQVAVLDRAPAAEVAGAALVSGGIVMSDVAQAGAALQGAADKLGGIDALVNVAGGFRWETLADGQVDSWDLLYEMNLRTAVVACQQALPFLLKQPAGRIVNVGALGALKAGMGMGAYAASKAGVARLTEALAEELKDKGITVNAVLPSIIDTPTNRADMPDADASRWVTPAALARVIAFLLSDDGAPITGASIPVSGRV
jgi:NAD(P)-dependent dehydrogenase (short-subunit alcohol dehydrogenase family)